MYIRTIHGFTLPFMTIHERVSFCLTQTAHGTFGGKRRHCHRGRHQKVETFLDHRLLDWLMNHGCKISQTTMHNQLMDSPKV